MSYIEPAVLIRNRTLRIERKQRGWTQARLARAMGVATRTVIRWERGLALPHPTHRAQLERLFGKTAEELGLWWDTDEDMVGKLVLAAPLPVTHQAILKTAHQASLFADGAIPRTLGTNNGLLGRTELLMQIKERLLDANSVPKIALYGLPGIGKTTLALAIAADEQVQAHFCDGILWAPLGPQPYVLGQMMRLGALLGVTSSEVENPESTLAWEQALRSAIGSRRMLLIIDDAWGIEDALALQVGGPQCAYLLTTHQSQVAFTQRAIMVPQLEEADALALLACSIPQFIRQDPQTAQSLVQAMDCLPLALTLMGKSLASSTLPQYLWPLRMTLMQLRHIQDHLRLNTLDTSEQKYYSFESIIPFSLYSTIAMCIRQLSQKALTTLSALAIFPPKPHRFSEEAALVISQQPREMLDELCNTGLLECWEPGRYSLHQMVAYCVRSGTSNKIEG